MSKPEAVAQAISEEVIASCKPVDYVLVLKAVIKRLEDDLKTALEDGDGDMEELDDDEGNEKE